MVVAQRAAAGDGHDGHEPAGPAELVADMRGHIHPVSLVAAELERDFTVGPPVPGPYLHRWNLDLSCGRSRSV